MIFNSLLTIPEKCSHVRAHHLFLESLSTEFIGVQCVSYEEITDRKCTLNNITGKMGGNLDKNSPKPFGIFYLETNLEAPYVKPDVKTFNNVDFVAY